MAMYPILSQIEHSARLALRSQQIVWAIYWRGLGGAFTSLGFELTRRGLRFAGAKKVKATQFDALFGRNLAGLFITLGPTFIKLGQMLATRPDLIGDAAAEELKVLYDRVPPRTYREIQAILKSELGKQKLKESFKEIDKKPLASASLSQTHRGTLWNGTPVIIKVQKQGVAETVKLDLALLETLAIPIDLAYPQLQLRRLVGDFKDATLREIDYREEAKNMSRFEKNYKKLFSDREILVPRCYDSLTTQKVLVMEPMHGVSVAKLRKGSTVARKAAALSLHSVLEQIFDHGFFHADPHAGNLFFLEENGQLGFIDLGLVGHLDRADKQKFLKVVLAILKRDRKELAKCLFQLGTASRDTSYAAFEQSVNELIDRMNQQKQAGQIKLEEAFQDLLKVARSHGVHVPNRYVLLLRACLMIEGVAKGLDPNINFVQVATPIVAKSLFKTYNPLGFFRK